MECEVRSVQCGAWNVECKVWSGKCGVNCGVWSLEREVKLGSACANFVAQSSSSGECLVENLLQSSTGNYSVQILQYKVVL